MKSKTGATWLALLGGALGLHRFYLYGLRDIAGWLYSPPTLLGLYGVHRMRQLGQDDPLAWLLIPLLGLALSAAMLSAVLYGLTTDERWRDRHNPQGPIVRNGWPVIFGVVLALFIGAGVLMATLAFSSQRYFEQAEQLAR